MKKIKKKIFNLITKILLFSDLLALICVVIYSIVNKNFDLDKVFILLILLLLLSAILFIRFMLNKKWRLSSLLALLFSIILLFSCIFLNHAIYFVFCNGSVDDANLNIYVQLLEKDYTPAHTVLNDYYSNYADEMLDEYKYTDDENKYLIANKAEAVLEIQYLEKLDRDISSTLYKIIVEHDIYYYSIISKNENVDSNYMVSKLKLAEKEFESENYKQTYEIYNSLICQGYGNDIIYNNLAYLYSEGYGVDRNLSKAHALYEISYEMGNNDALANIAIMHLKSIVDWEPLLDALNSASEVYNDQLEYFFVELYAKSGIEKNSSKSYSLDFADKTYDEKLIIFNSIGLDYSFYTTVVVSLGEQSHYDNNAYMIRNAGVVRCSDGLCTKYNIYTRRLNLDYLPMESFKYYE